MLDTLHFVPGILRAQIGKWARRGEVQISLAAVAGSIGQRG